MTLKAIGKGWDHPGKQGDETRAWNGQPHLKVCWGGVSSPFTHIFPVADSNIILGEWTLRPFRNRYSTSEVSLHQGIVTVCMCMSCRERITSESAEEPFWSTLTNSPVSVRESSIKKNAKKEKNISLEMYALIFQRKWELRKVQVARWHDTQLARWQTSWEEQKLLGDYLQPSTSPEMYNSPAVSEHRLLIHQELIASARG